MAQNGDLPRNAKLVAQTRTECNACSLEVLHSHLHPTNDGKLDTATTTATSSAKNFFPLVIGCYQLIEDEKEAATLSDDEKDKAPEAIKQGQEDVHSGADETDDETEQGDEEPPKKKPQKRTGQLRTYTMAFPPSSDKQSETSDYIFGTPSHVCTIEEGGVLDSKWLPHSVHTIEGQDTHVLASALSSGDIAFHALQREGFCDKESVTSATPYGLHRLPAEKNSNAADSGDSGFGLSLETICLALDWSSSASSPATQCNGEDRLLSSYSNGQLVVHQVTWPANSMDKAGGNPVQMEELYRWNAHSLFGKILSEVWTCCWAKPSNVEEPSSIVVSGGDDGTMKGWDLRTLPSTGSLARPIFIVGDEEFEAGVTAMAWHPTQEHYFVSGSYDEAVRLWDVRMLSSVKRSCPPPVAKVDSCGGGIWRLKWHPADSTKLLVGAMHGGCRVLDVSIDSSSMEILSSFKLHESMAYGADWLPQQTNSISINDSGGENPFCKEQSSLTSYFAGSCSFYDQHACIWNATA
jgi:WD40 repeat protein